MSITQAFLVLPDLESSVYYSPVVSVDVEYIELTFDSDCSLTKFFELESYYLSRCSILCEYRFYSLA